MAPKAKGGIRRRLGISQSSGDVPHEVPVPPARRLRGGIRARLNIGKAKPTKKKAFTRKLNGPLVQTLKRNWGAGKISAKDAA